MSTEKRERQKANRESSRLAAARNEQSARNRRRLLIAVFGILVLTLLGAYLAFSGDDDTVAGSSDNSDTAGTSDSADGNDPAATAEGCPAEDGSSPRTIDFAAAQPMCIDPSQTHVAVFDTSEGEIRVELDSTNTPLTANNFVTLARWGYYDGTTLFRTDPSIEIIQGGSPHTESPSDPGPGYTITDEPTFDLDDSGNLTGPYRYVAGQLVMARSAGPNSASAQFFFTTGPNASLLDGQGVYVVFGTTDDVDVLQEIIGLHVPGASLGGAPSREVMITSVTIEVS